jgi:UDP-N-acetylmuramoyl-tripeptide--D-alanyl-D-alanine ligase
MLGLDFVLNSTKGKLISGRKPGEFAGVSTDSRKISAGEIFFALKGDNYDGHKFVDEALRKGAAGAVIENSSHAYNDGKLLIQVPSTIKALGDLASEWRKSFPGLRLAAITGSNGKTTTKEMASSIISLKYKTLKNTGNFNNLIGLPLTLFRLDGSYKAAVVELGMNEFGEIRRLAEIARPDTGAITNIGRAHLEKLGGLEGVAKAKGELVEGFNGDRIFIVNADDPRIDRISQGVKCRKITYGITTGGTDITAKDIEPDGFSGITFRMIARGKDFSVRINGIGMHNVMNALCASGIAVSFGCVKEEIVEGLLNFHPSYMRLELLSSPAGFRVINDTYNANPDSMRSAVDELMRLKGQGRAIAVLGDMLELGESSEGEHVGLGEYLSASGVDFAIACGGFGRALLRGADAKTECRYASSHEEAARMIKEIARPGDLVLVKGSRGMRMEEVTKRLV